MLSMLKALAFPSFGFADGGIAPGGFKAFASGGIVDRPTLGLVGEGRYNEAIVPLPNGKSIPVDLRGSGQNNQQGNNQTIIVIQAWDTQDIMRNRKTIENIIAKAVNTNSSLRGTIKNA